MKPTSPAIRTLVIAIIIAAILSVVAIFASDMIASEGGKFVLVCLSVILYAIPGTLAVVGYEKNKALGGAGIAVTLIAFLLTVVLIFVKIEDLTVVRLAGTFFIASIALGHICLLHHFHLRNNYARIARLVGTIAICVFSGLLISRIFDSLMVYDSFLRDQATQKIIVSALVIDLAATALVPLCNRLKGE